MNPIERPEIKLGLNSYSYSWPTLGVLVEVNRLDEDGIGELRFFHENGDGKKLLHFTRLNLLSTPSCNQTAKRLMKNAELDWDSVLTYVSSLTLDLLRKGEPAVSIGKKPESTRVDYQLYPILQKGQPTTIYSPGGGVKSYLSCYIACLVQFGIIGLPLSDTPWRPQKGNVLILDWESGEQDVSRRAWVVKRGLGINNDDTFLYRHCEQPLITDVPNIQRIVSENKIDTVIVDSQMAASGYGPDPAQMASQYYNALRSLRCTTLTLDHISKSEWRNSDTESTGPYGSVVKFNRSRSQFEIKKSQTPGDDVLFLSLVHRKNNEGRLLKPIGVQVNFLNNDEGHLDAVVFSNCNVGDDPILSRTLTLRERLINCLGNGPQTVKELADATDKTETQVRAELNRHKGIFNHVGEEWELKAVSVA